MLLQIKTYTKKPVDIQAVQFESTDSHFVNKLAEWCGGTVCAFLGNTVVDGVETAYEFTSSTGIFQVPVPPNVNIIPFIEIPTLEGIMRASLNDYIIKGVNGEFYPCRSDIFEKTYTQKIVFHFAKNYCPSCGKPAF